MGSLYLRGRSIQEMGGDVVIGRSIYGVVVIDGSLYSRFYGIGLDVMQSHPVYRTYMYMSNYTPKFLELHIQVG